MSSEPIKVLIVDDIPSTLDNLQKLLSFEPDIQVVATAVNGKEGVEQAKKVAPVDLDLQFGDIGVLLNLDHSQSITDLIENIDHMDQEFIREIMSDGPFG